MFGFGRRFSAFLAGQALNAIGSWATVVAIWGYAAYEFDADVGDISLVGLAWLGPAVLIGPFAGVPIDRFGPKTVLIAAKAAGAVVSVALATVDSFGALVVLSIGHGIVFAFTEPALDAVPPRVVADDRLASANAILRASTDLAIVAGPVVAAASIRWWGFQGAFLFDAATYVVGIGVTLGLSLNPLPTKAATDTAPERRIVGEVLDGFRLVRRSPYLRSTIALTGAVYFLYGTALLLEPIYVRDVLDESVETFALLQSAFGVTLVGMGLVVARLGDRVATLRVLSLVVIGSAIGAFLYMGTSSLVVSGLGVMAWGGVSAFLTGPSRTLLQRHTPPDTQGRVLALDRTVENGAHLVALPVTGGLAMWLGVQGAVACIAVVLAGLGLFAARRVPRIDAADHPDETPPPHIQATPVPPVPDGPRHPAGGVHTAERGLLD